MPKRILVTDDEKVVAWLRKSSLLQQILARSCREERINYAICDTKASFLAEVERQPKPVCLIIEYIEYRGGFGGSNYQVFEDLRRMPIPVLLLEQGRGDDGYVYVRMISNGIQAVAPRIERIILAIDRFCQDDEEWENREEKPG